MSGNLFKIIALEWWTQDLDSGVWLCLLYNFPCLPHHSADQLSLPLILTRQGSPGGEMPTRPSCLSIFYAVPVLAPHQLVGAQVLTLREILIGPVGGGGRVPPSGPVSLAREVRACAVQGSAHPFIRGRGRGKFQRREWAGRAVPRMPTALCLMFTPLLPTAPQDPPLFLFVTLKTQRMT